MQNSVPELVSVVIPCFEHGRFLAAAVDSALAQTRRPVEVVIVDDGSTDPATVAEIDRQGEREHVTVVRTENRGLAAARNTGVQHSRGEFVLPLDADDLLEPEFLARTVPLLQAEERVGVVYTDVAYFGSKKGCWRTPEFDFVDLLCRNLMTATSVFRRRCFDEVGGFDESMREGFEDWEFWIAICARGWRGQRVPELLFRYRQHRGGSMLANTQRRRRAIYRYIVGKHRGTFAEHLEDVMAQKDTMFFEQLQARGYLEARFGWAAAILGRIARLFGRGQRED
ncbi:MAG: glycosyltransferase family 2 protein [bacterium]|nr:glycosyltransferase family 2 protein [bacterium]